MKIQLFFNILFVAFVAVGIASCDDVEYFSPLQPTDSGDPFLTLSESSVTVLAEKGEMSVQVQSNASWTATSDAEWCEVNPPSNRGDSRLLLRYAANPSIVQRTATISLAFGQETTTLEVIQPGAPLVSPAYYKAGVALTSFAIEIKAEGVWNSTVTCDGDWCSLALTEGEGPTSNTIEVASNHSGSTRTALIEVICGENRTILTVEQAGTLATPELTLTDTGDVLSVGWMAVEGAVAYQIQAIDGEEVVASVQVDANVTEYDLDANQESFFADYVGPAILQIEAITADPEITSKSSASALIHSHFAVSSGDGNTAETAFVISGIRHLRNIHRFASTYHYYRQDADIFLPVSEDGHANFTPISSFSGSYDGGNHLIDGLTLVSSTGNCGFIGSSAGGTETFPVVIAHLTFNRVTIRSTASGAAPTAAVVGNASAWLTLEDCHVSNAAIEANANQIGGLVGNAAGNCTIENSSFHGTLSGGNNVGGICANGSLQISRCRNEGTVIGKAYVGGIAGSMASGSIEYCYNIGSVTATNSGDSPAGGIIGRAQGGSGGVRISCCFNNGEVKSSHSSGSNIGGIIGKTGDATSSIVNCYNAGSVVSQSGVNEAGGIIGLLSGASGSEGLLVNCYNVGSVSASMAGSIAGKITNATNAVSGCHYLLVNGQTGVFNGSLAGTEGHESAAMLDFSTYAGWDPVIWTIESGYAYPQLKECPHK